MSDTVIRVENLGKKYIIGHQKQERYTALRDVMANGVKSIGQRFLGRKSEDPTHEEFWALKDVSFEVKRGERVGIIGRNGAGKSTLLKILSRITEPTSGRVTINGRVASLLEVGTGFHPELTGRENIFLNGAILGMSKVEIQKKFDEIVAFAEVEKFLDTPVKRYSSGMYVRLAFAVAAHLEPEILVVDEVLAVGDTQFQKKCLGKMEDVAEREGRTVLFVSHQMTAINSLCTESLLLKNGKIALWDQVEKVTQKYLSEINNLAHQVSLEKRKDRQGTGRVRAVKFRVLNEHEQPVTSMESGKNYIFEIEYVNFCNTFLNDIVFSIDLVDENSVRVLLLRTNFTGSNLILKPESGVVRCKVVNLPLALGLYSFTIFISCQDYECLDWIENVVTLSIDGGDFFGTGSPGLPSHCKILFRTEWLSN